MHSASLHDKQLVLEILARAFDENQSVNYIIPQDYKRKERIIQLMDYSFEECLQFGEVLLSDDKNAVALLLYPDKKKTSLRSISRDIRFIRTCIGISRLKKALNRESKIKKHHPATPFCHLWFVGVSTAQQGKGIGSKLLQEIIEHTDRLKRPIYLETSTLKNIPCYRKWGFEIYKELEFSYRLYMMHRKANQG